MQRANIGYSMIAPDGGEAAFIAIVAWFRLLGQVAGRSITPAQHDTVERIRIFIQQSEAEKSKDISTAVQLARRADLLGQDLVKSLSQ